MAAFMSRLIRLLMIVAALVLAAGVVLFVVGGNSHMYTTAVQVDAPQSTVFRGLLDPTLRQQWMHQVERIDPLSEGELQAGAKQRITLRASVGTRSQDEEILEFKPPDSILLEVRTPREVIRSAFHLSRGSQDKIVVDYTRIVTAQGLARLTAAFSGSEVLPQMQRDLDKFRQVVESVAEDPSGDMDRQPSANNGSSNTAADSSEQQTPIDPPRFGRLRTMCPTHFPLPRKSYSFFSV